MPIFTTHLRFELFYVSLEKIKNCFLLFILIFINVIFCFFFSRFLEPEPIEEKDLLLTVGCIGLVVNILGLFLLHGKLLRVGFFSLLEGPTYKLNRI